MPESPALEITNLPIGEKIPATTGHTVTDLHPTVGYGSGVKGRAGRPGDSRVPIQRLLGRGFGLPVQLRRKFRRRPQRDPMPVGIYDAKIADTPFLIRGFGCGLYSPV